ncbi:DUF6878 family protein [Acetobacter peroxydans]|uniref:DUF6878 domain-containing protein n=1 Tax=Acetobacter peroxydans TaxID=104098 RepID=A0A4Y3TZU4_9PROT|nr:DUF6878 family protein [Acetobacter peroxydans]NHO17156.1 hypothetical protein [Acetobacter peroxydans]GBR38731.1 hypothetical protein AA13755_2254 [Acetobacter peroxydans NBRC 13755]GBR39449.1 hypothetical protein AA0475_0193 [Acetobacter peroxydans]GEB86225.1 hypothetical protein APE01nite_20220 [Acetobacter peroxydans]
MTETLAMLEQMDRYNRLKRESQTEDRATVMAALKACGITKVVIRYDGYGDSGGVEECTVEGGQGQESLTVPVQTVILDWSSAEKTIQMAPLREVLETLAMQYVAVEHSGWENNEGGSGDVTFDPIAGTITVSHTENYVASEDFIHTY